jgi:hypothetical protein
MPIKASGTTLLWAKHFSIVYFKEDYQNWHDTFGIWRHIPKTFAPWFGPSGRAHSGVEWFPLRIMCNSPLKGLSSQPPINLPPCSKAENC